MSIRCSAVVPMHAHCHQQPSQQLPSAPSAFPHHSPLPTSLININSDQTPTPLPPGFPHLPPVLIDINSHQTLCQKCCPLLTALPRCPAAIKTLSGPFPTSLRLSPLPRRHVVINNVNSHLWLATAGNDSNNPWSSLLPTFHTSRRFSNVCRPCHASRRLPCRLVLLLQTWRYISFN